MTDFRTVLGRFVPVRLARRPVRGSSVLTVVVAAVLLCLGAANLLEQANWLEAEDGVRWIQRPEGGVVAAEIKAGGPASAAGVKVGDVLLAVNGQPVDATQDVVDAVHRGTHGTVLTYSLARLASAEFIQVRLAPTTEGNRGLYFILAIIGIFALGVGSSVRVRRPADQATLHFFWLCLAFFGAFTFSASGRFDRLDWFFYWADVVARLLLPPLFLHFTLVFPDRSSDRAEARTRRLVYIMYIPAAVLGGLQAVSAATNPDLFIRITQTADRLEPLYLAICFGGGFAILVRALRRVRSGTARRQLRWIGWGTLLGTLPFSVVYALPYAFGVEPSRWMELSALPLGIVPLAFASAIVRYRLMDVEVIIKRGLVYVVAVAAIVGIYTVLWRLAGDAFHVDSGQHNLVIAVLATLVVVLLARPVKDAIQTTFDRAFYRDRYDYRRALVGFARDLNRDLDLGRLSERLVARVMETLGVEQMALMLADEGGSQFRSIRAAGFPDAAPPPPLDRSSGIGGRLDAGHSAALDDPLAARRFCAEELADWAQVGLQYFVPCVSKTGTIAVLALGRKVSGEPLTSEDVALLRAVAGQVATALENGRLYGELRRKAQELERMRQFNEDILESLDEGLMVVDSGDRVIRWNHALEAFSGLERGQALGRGIGEILPADFVDAICAARRENPAGAMLYKIPLSLRERERRRVNVATIPLRASSHQVSGTIIIIEDVTSRVQLEEQLQIAEKMASLGLLAAGVAHEVNTPLTGISSYTQMLLEGADPQDPKTRLLEKIERQTFRASKIVNGLLNFARSSGADTTPVDLNTVINDVLSLLEHQFKLGKIKVRKTLLTPPPVVIGIENKLQQVFLNLLLNARDAMPKGGWLSITTRIEGDSAVAHVADTGSGILREHLSRIYDPFFTTKAMGQGTGLGLSITYGIVQEHGGTIQCESTIGQGTSFTVLIPLAPASVLQKTVRN